MSKATDSASIKAIKFDYVDAVISVILDKLIKNNKVLS